MKLVLRLSFLYLFLSQWIALTRSCANILVVTRQARVMFHAPPPYQTHTHTSLGGWVADLLALHPQLFSRILHRDKATHFLLVFVQPTTSCSEYQKANYARKRYIYLREGYSVPTFYSTFAKTQKVVKNTERFVSYR